MTATQEAPGSARNREVGKVGKNLFVARRQDTQT